MKKLHALLCVLALLLAPMLGLSSCAAPLVPPPRLSAEQRQEPGDEALLSLLREDWVILASPDVPVAEQARVADRYNRNLLHLLRRIRYDAVEARKAGQAYEPRGFRFHRSIEARGLHLGDVYEDIVPALDVALQNLEERYAVAGVGVPLVGIIPASKVDKMGKLDTFFHLGARGTVSTLTALMEFPEVTTARSGEVRPGKKGRGSRPAGHKRHPHSHEVAEVDCHSVDESLPVLRLLPRQRQEEVVIGSRRYSLAGDFSAPLEVYWDLTRVREDRFLGLLQPQKLRDVSGLSCIEAYQPGRIPVILTHGLMSSAGTFDNLDNRLLSDPLIRRNYQFWYFNYPTGVAWTISAAEYRRELAEVRRTVDPHFRNKNWDNMVVVGHSMGGLITHYSQCVEPWRMLENNPVLPESSAHYLDARYVDEPIPVPAYEALRADYFFRPVKAGQVIYLATPHRGAPLARYRIVTALTKLVHLPETIVNEAINLATLQQDSLLLNPENLTSWFTSVGQLAPDSYSIRGLQGLAVQSVPTHSVIGNDGCTNRPLEKTSDGVVPYWSSHISWGTETVVPASHSVQDAPETAEDVAEVLKAHLERSPRSRRRVR